MEWADLSRIVFALLAVLGFIGLSALAARKAGLAQQGFALARRKRLSLVETITLDARRRLAIIRCDGKEHLVILGAAGETVIETGMPALEQECEAPGAAPLAGVTAPGLNMFRRAIKGAADPAAAAETKAA